MKLLIPTLLLATVMAVPAAATVVNFDDLPGSGLVPDGYGGITWNSNFLYYGSPQTPYNPSSPPNRIYSNYALHGAGVQDTLIFDFATPVSFDGLYASGAGIGTVDYDLYLGGTFVATSASIVTSGTPTFIGNSYTGLADEVRINAYNGYSVYDDVTFDGGTVPEPAAWALMIAGFGLVGTTLRRRRDVAVAA